MNQPPSGNSQETIDPRQQSFNGAYLRIRADAPAPTSNADHAPAELLVAVERAINPRVWLLAEGPHAIDAHPAAAHARTVDRPGRVLIPALINAHAHLDLTHMGPFPADPLEPGSPASSFAAFGSHVLAHRLDDADDLITSVTAGARLSLAVGVAALADIAGVWRTEPREAAANAGLRGISHLEVFGHGDRIPHAIQRLKAIFANLKSPPSHDPMRLGISPHAPYSAGLDLYKAAQAMAIEHQTHATTHLAECPEEHQFVASATGPIHDLLERLGGIDAATEQEFSQGGHPIDHIAPALSPAWTVVHVNDASDDAIARLASTGAVVVYCPRASAYFAHERHFGPHRYRDMIDAGIPVAIGTDSIICLPPNQADRISPLDDARFLFQRDNTDPRILFDMLYANAARALAIDPSLVTIPPKINPHTPHELLGLLAADVRDAPQATHDQAARVLASRRQPERLTADTP